MRPNDCRPCMEMDVPSGQNIAVAAEQAVKLAQHTNMAVYFNFNDTTLRVGGGMSVQTVVSDYHRLREVEQR